MLLLKWRDITLLSTSGKIMVTVIVNILRDTLDEKLRQEQAGFMPGRSCCEHIFTLRQIIEKTLMWQTPVRDKLPDIRRGQLFLDIEFPKKISLRKSQKS